MFDPDMEARQEAISMEAEAWLLNQNILIDGHFPMAGGAHSLQKVEFEPILTDPKRLLRLAEYMLEIPEVRAADALLGVPSGGQLLARAIWEKQKRDPALITIEKTDTRGKFQFSDHGSELTAKEEKAGKLVVIEDVSSTGSQVAGVRNLIGRDITAVSAWRRGKIKPEYNRGVNYRFLVEHEIRSYARRKCPDPVCRG